MNVPPINYGGKVQRLLGRRGCRRDYDPRPDRPTTLPRRGRSTALARFARSAIPRPGVIGDVYRSTPCRVRRDRAVTTFRHDPCLTAHDVPLRV